MSKTSRPLGDQEHLLNLIHNYTGLIVLQVLHIKGDVQPDALRQALEWLQKRHTMARTHVEERELVFSKSSPYIFRKPYFVSEGTAAIPLRVTNKNWEDELAHEIKMPLAKGNSPRLRVTLVQEPEKNLNHIITCADHAAIDAQSINMISRDLLQFLGDPSVGSDVSPADDGISPPLEAGYPQKTNSGGGEYIPAIRIPLSKHKSKVKGTRIVNRRIEPADLAVIKAAAAQNRTSLHGAISAAFLSAMRDRFGLNELTCATSVDLRKMSKPPVPADVFGCYIDVVRTKHKTDVDFWTLAKDTSFRVISTLMRTQETASILKMWGWPVYKHELIPLMKNRARLDALGITTAHDSGFVERYGDLELANVTMSVSLDLFGPGVMVIGCERTGGMDLSMSYFAQALSKEDAVDLTDRAIAHLQAQIEQKLQEAG